MDWVNEGPPTPDKLFRPKDKKWNYGFYDFVLAEITPELCYEEQSWSFTGRKIDLPPEHPRAVRIPSYCTVPGPLIYILTSKLIDQRDKNHKIIQAPYGARDTNPYSKYRSCYRTMAYGWGNKDDVLDFNSTTNKYCDIEGYDAEDSVSQAFAKFVPLLIPGGLKKVDTFRIDLNKGVRALYFPARYKFSDGLPGHAAYAKISFVDEYQHNLIDAHNLMDQHTFIKQAFNWSIDLDERARKTEETIALEKKYHTGAYSTNRTLIVNIPQFVDLSYLVAKDPKTAPYDALYLAKSAEISSTRYTASGGNIPPKDGVFWWESHVKDIYAES